MEPTTPFVVEVAERVGMVRDRIARAGGVRVEIVAVTKGFGPEAIVAAAAAGVTRIGENYAQELVSKVPAARALGAEFECHFIGHLQTNKVRSLAPLVDIWETIDRPAAVVEVAKRAGSGARMLLQVNTTGEPAKSGCSPDQVELLLESAHEAGAVVEGLMAIGPTDGDPIATRRAFRATRALADRFGLVQCSMGMSADLEIAVEEGATLIRVGRALFGDRPTR